MFQIKEKEINPVAYLHWSKLPRSIFLAIISRFFRFSLEIKRKEGKKSWLESLVDVNKKTTMERNDPHLALDRVFEIEVREIKLIGIWDGHDTRVDGTFLHRNASSPSGLERRCLRPNISDSLRKHICLRTNTAKARGEGEAEPSWRCLEAKWNAECVWDCLHCRTIFRVFWRTRAERGAPLFYLASPSPHPFPLSVSSFLFKHPPDFTNHLLPPLLQKNKNPNL